MAVVVVFALLQAFPPIPRTRATSGGLEVADLRWVLGFFVSIGLGIAMGVVILLGDWIEAVLLRQLKTTDQARRARIKHTIRLVLVLMLAQSVILNCFLRFALLMSLLRSQL
jgi:hypothetical protein